MRVWLKILGAVFILTFGTGHAQWGALAEVNGRYGDYLRGGGVQMWAPLYQDGRSLLFVQGGVGDYAHALGTHVGLGYRALACPGVAWGVNAFADYAYSDWKRMFQQYGVGAELMSGCWVLRANGYAAVHNPKEVGSEEQFVFCRTTEQQITVCSSIRLRLLQAYSGTDVEAGYRLGTRCGELWGFVGYYYFGAHRVKNFHGPRVRAELRCCELPCLWGSQFVIGGEYHYDRRHKSQGDFELTLRMPLGRCGCRVPLCGPTVCSRMAEPVRRMPIIVTERDTERRRRLIERDFATIFFINGVPEAGGVEPLFGAGTQQQPASLANAQLIAGPQDIVIGLTGNGATFAVATPILTKTEQQWGSFNGAPSITVTLPGGSEIVIPNLTGSGRITFVGAATDVFPLVEGVRLFEVDIQGGQRAIQSSGTSNLTVDNVNITGTTGNGIELTNTTGATVSGTTVSTAGADGIVISGGSNTTLTNVTVTNPTTNAVQISNHTNPTLTTVQTTGGAGRSLLMDTVSGGQVTGSNFGTANGGGVRFIAPTGTFAMTASTVNPAGGPAFDFSAGTGSQAFTGNTITAAAAQPLFTVDGGANTVTFPSGTMTATGGTIPISIANTTGGSVQIGTTTLTNPTTNGVALANNLGAINLSGLTINSNTAAIGLNVTGETGSVTTAGSSITQTAGGKALVVAGGAPVMDLSGLTLNNTGGATPIDIQNTTGGSVQLGPTTLTNPTMSGVTLTNNACSIALNSLTLNSNTTATGLAINAQAGTVTSAGSSITQTAGGKAVTITGAGGAIDLSGLVLDNTGGAAPVDLTTASGGQITFGQMLLTDPTTAGIRLAGSSAPVSFSNATLNVASGVPGFSASSQTGNVVFTGSTLTQSGGGTALSVSGSNATFTLDGLTIGATGAATGIDLSNNAGGVFSFVNPTVTDPTGTGINLNTNGASVVFNGAAVNVAAGTPTALSVVGHAGAITSVGSTITQAGGGASVLVDGASSSVDLSGFTVNNTGSTVTPVTVQNAAAGLVQLNNVTVTNTSAANAALISNNTGTVSLTGFTSTATTGGTLALTGGPGAITIANSSVAAVNAPGLVATNAVVDAAGWTFTGVSSTNSASNAVAFTGVTGTGTVSIPTFTASGATAAAVSVDGGSPIVTIGTPNAAATATITGGAAGAFDIINGAPTFNYFGAVTNPVTTLANINGLTGGAVTLDGREAGASQVLAQTGGGGVVVTNCGANFTIRGAAITNPTGLAMSFTTSTGAVTVSNSAITNVPGNGIQGNGQIGPITVTDSTFTGAPTDAISLVDQRGTVTATSNNFIDINWRGVIIVHSDPGTLTAIVSNNTESTTVSPNPSVNATYTFNEVVGAGLLNITDLSGNSGTRTGTRLGILFDNYGTISIPNVTPPTTLSGVNTANPGMSVGADNEFGSANPVPP